MRKEIALPVVLLAAALLSCNLPSGGADVTGEPEGAVNGNQEGPDADGPGEIITIEADPPVEEEAVGTTAPTMEPSGPCMIVSSVDHTVYSRPGTAAQVFGTLGAGMEIQATAQTADGWWGFDPGVAQAANMGVFRYRWVQDDPSLIKSGGCSALPVLVGPPPGVCFTMPMGDVPVLAGPVSTEAVLLTMTPGDYAAVTGRTPDGWAQLDLAVGSLGLEGTGWMEAVHLNMNGPCDSISEIP